MPLLSDAEKCYVGNTPINKIYTGSELVWPKAPDSCDVYPANYQTLGLWKFEQNLNNSYPGIMPSMVQTEGGNLSYTTLAGDFQYPAPDGYCIELNTSTSDPSISMKSDRLSSIDKKAIKIEFWMQKNSKNLEERYSCGCSIGLRSRISRPGQEYWYSTLVFGLESSEQQGTVSSTGALAARIINPRPDYTGITSLYTSFFFLDYGSSWQYMSMEYNNSGLWSWCMQPFKEGNSNIFFQRAEYAPGMLGVNQSPMIEWVQFDAYHPNGEVCIDELRVSTIDE